MRKHRLTSIEKSTGNIYSDLGYPNNRAMLIKAQLVAKIAEIIRTRKLTQAEAASKLGSRSRRCQHC
jgi:predicted XRE-type DNA-binding protein